MSTIAETPESPQIGSTEIHWKSWPLQRPPVATLVALGVVAVGAGVYFVIASPTMLCLSLITLGLAGWRLLVPIDFTVDEGGVKQQWLGRRRYDEWNSFRAFSSPDHGFILWPRVDCCLLDVTRSLFLPCSREKAELVALLRRHLMQMP